MIAVLIGCCESGYSPLPRNIDHLVYAAPDLETGMDAIEALLGVRPVPGGRHPNYGTHNALLSLGATTYLEVIAPDPGLPEPERGRLASMGRDTRPRLATWVLSSDSIVETAAAAAGIGVGAVQSGSRETPNGNLLAWQLTDPYVMPLQGAVPFLISWGDTVHPAAAAPRAGELVGFRIEHPEPNLVCDALSVLGPSVEVREANEFRLVAMILTANGTVELH